MPRDLITEGDLVDQVAAMTGRIRTSTLAAAIIGRRQALAALDQQQLPARSPHRMLRYLLAVLGMLAVYTGLMTLRWQTAANWTLAGLVLVGFLAAWIEERRSDPAASELPVHDGFADDPTVLEQQLAELRPPGPAPFDVEVLPEYAAARVAADSEIAADCACAARWDAAVAQTLALFDDLEHDEHEAFDALERRLAQRMADARRRFGIEVAEVGAFTVGGGPVISDFGERLNLEGARCRGVSLLAAADYAQRYTEEYMAIAADALADRTADAADRGPG